MTGDKNHAKISSFGGNNIYFMGFFYSMVFKACFHLIFSGIFTMSDISYPAMH